MGDFSQRRLSYQRYNSKDENAMVRLGDIIDCFPDSLSVSGLTVLTGDTTITGDITAGGSLTVAAALTATTTADIGTTLTVDAVNEHTTDDGVTIDGILIKDGSIVSSLSPVTGFPIWNGIDPSDWITFIDDFIDLDITTVGVGAASSLGYYIQGDHIGTTGAEDGLGGWLEIGAPNTDNHEVYLASTNEAFLFDTDKKFVLKCRIKLTEANTDDANWVIGVSDTAGANFLQDNGAGPAASYDGAIFFKVDGTMKIQFETSNAAAQVTNATLADFASATTYNLAFVYDYGNGTTGSITPYVNGVAGTAHAITIAGLEEMHFVMGVKTGDTNAESLMVDYVAIAQERR